MRRPALVRAVAGVLPFRPAAALATPLTGSFSSEEQFIAEPGDVASYSFPVAVELQVRGTDQVLSGLAGRAGPAGEAAGGAALDRYRHRERLLGHRARRTQRHRGSRGPP
jgi:hypothetical protein